MNQDKLKTLAQEAAKMIETEADLNEFRQILTKITVETALNAEMANLKSIRHGIEKVASNRNWLRNANVDSPRWLTDLVPIRPGHDHP